MIVQIAPDGEALAIDAEVSVQPPEDTGLGLAGPIPVGSRVPMPLRVTSKPASGAPDSKSKPVPLAQKESRAFVAAERKPRRRRTMAVSRHACFRRCARREMVAMD
jgi:hypothetical protein